MKKICFSILSLIFILFTSCKNNESNVEEFKFPNENLIIGNASPIQLDTDSTIIRLKDFIPEDVEITEIKTHEAVIHSFSKDSLNLILKVISDDLPKLSFLKINFGWIEHAILLKKSNKTKHTFIFDPKGKKYNKVHIKGEFNAWNPNATKLRLSDDGIWQQEIEIEPGTYQYVYVIDGKEMPDPANPDKISNGMGAFNSVLKSGLIEKNKLPVIHTSTFEPNVINITYENNVTELLVTYRNFELDKSFDTI